MKLASERDYRLWLDIDADSNWFWRTPLWDDLLELGRMERCHFNNPLWDDLLELVRMEALRLGQMFALGDRALIIRSDNGWFLRFPKARLTKEEELSVMWVSQSHFGHRFFSDEIQDTTHRAAWGTLPSNRIGAKPEKHSHPPYLVEIINLTEGYHGRV